MGWLKKCLCRDENLLVLLELVDKLNGDVEGLGDEVGRGESEPLAQRDVSHAVGLVDLDPDEVLGLGGVLNVVATWTLLAGVHGLGCFSWRAGYSPRVVREESSVTGSEVVGAGVVVTDEDGGTGLSRVEVEPLIGLSNTCQRSRITTPAPETTYSRVPVELAQSTGLEGDKGGGNGLADGEVGGVNLVESTAAAGNLLGGVVKSVVRERRVTLALGGINGGRADGGIDNVRVLGRDLVKGGGGDAKVLGQDVLGGVGDPVVNVEGGSGGTR